jgi:hypothetical protein
METTMKETNDEDMFSIHSLAFALLECRSEKEALLVFRYFADPESRKSTKAKRVRRANGATPLSK